MQLIIRDLIYRSPHKIFLYKEDFDKFVHGLSETLDYIRSHRPMPEPELQE